MALKNLDRQEAVNFIREINQECESIRGTSIMLIAPHEADFPSRGFQVHFLMKADTLRLKCLELIAKEYGVEIKNDLEKWLVIVYDPIRVAVASDKGLA
jgi:hypothetical protein